MKLNVVLASAATAVVVALASPPLAPPASAASRDGVSSEGLVLRYAFEGLGPNEVRDLSGNGLDGRIVNGQGGRLHAPSLPRQGASIALRGVEHQYVDVPLRPVLDVDHWTLSAWVRYSGVENDKTGGRWEVLEKADAYWMNVRTSGVVRVGGFFGGCEGPGVWQYLDSAQPVARDTWTHLTGTYDGSTLSVYVNGVLTASRPVSGTTCVSGEPLAVGAKNNPAKGLLEAFWDGRLDDVRVYRRALEPAEITHLAQR
ncbi:LamG domain-containing protein [Micromonospora sp. NPDC000018]|uniref:LamG domain-containing protein n=1 Tax=Micromonospora sp. NPDC000018 TaxID=3154239 RepID=UPI00332947F9